MLSNKMYSRQLLTVVILTSIYTLYCAEFEFTSLEFPWPDLDFANAQAVGKVYISLGPGNESEEFSMNENARTGNVPVFIQLFNTSTRLPSQKFQDFVTLYCELTPSSLGYSEVQFIPTVVRPGIQPVVSSVPYRIENAGRTTDVRCWGVTTSALSNSQEFTKSLSISQHVPFTVRKKGTVNICSSQVLVSNTARTNTSTFILELSETVENNDVTISCSSTPAVPGSASLVLVFPTFFIAIGETKTRVTYQRDKTLGTGPVYVTCRGQSQGAGQFGQFFFNTSAGPPVLFVLDEGKVKIEPSLTRLYSSKMDLLLYLDAPVALSEVFFVCQAAVVNTTEEARNIADNPYCTAPTTPTPVLVTENRTQNDMEKSEITTMPNDKTTSNLTLTNESSTSDMFIDSFTNELELKLNDSSESMVTNDNVMTTEVPMTTESGIAWQPLSNATGDQLWRLLNENIIFQPGSIYRQLNLERISKATEPTQELIVVTCCAPASNNQDPKYQQQSAAILINAQMSGLVKINWTDAESIEVEQIESEILNPAYVETGPCPCDLTEENCDINCCCDSFCSADEISTFECILGPEGGNQGPNQDYYCAFEEYDTPDWHSFLCVHKNRTAFLGNFYYPKPKVETLTDLLPLIDDNTPVHDYRETAPRVPSEELLVGGYKQGFAVTTGLKQNAAGNADLYTGTNYRLSLPRRGYNGACLQTAPVRYLQDVSSDCVHQVTEEMCRADTIWSARTYVESSTQTDPSCPRSPQVLARHASKTVTNTGVNYFCASDLTGYLHSLETANDVLSSTEQYKFAFEIPKGREDECQFDPVSGVYICPLEPTFSNNPDLLLRCSWDDGFTAPPAPEYDNSTGICHNVVLDVHYNFTWQGSTILELNATMVIGDIAMTTTQTETVELEYENRTIINGTEVIEIVTKVENVTQVYQNRLTQKFGINFYPLYVAPNISDYNITDNVTDFFTEERYPRSGNPGYVLGKPVISGTAILNETDGSFHYIDSNNTNKFRLWQPGADGLCKNADSKVVTIGDDEITTCVLRLGFENFQDCNYLRRLVLSQQDALMTSEYVSIVGDPNRNIVSSEQWFQVLRENLTAIFRNSSEEKTQTTESTMTTEAEFLLSTAEDSMATFASTNITNENVTVVTTETPPPENIKKDINHDQELKGLCTNIPSNIHLEILYTEAGQINYKPIYNIRGARISYELNTWKIRCISAEGSSCYLRNDTTMSSSVQTFLVSSSVQFTEVPLEKPPPKTRYQLKNEEYDKYCKQDSCWSNLLYPFQKNFPGDSYAYTVGFSCVALIHIIGLFCITRPWW